jgi:hypothetical protein
VHIFAKIFATKLDVEVRGVMPDRMQILSAVVAFAMLAAPGAEARKRHGGHASHKVVKAHKMVEPMVRAPLVQAPVLAAPVVQAPVVVPVVSAFLPIATVIGAPMMTVAPVAAVAVPAPVIAAPVLAAPVMAAPMVAAPMVAASAVAAPVIATPAMAAPVVAVTSGAVLPPPSYSGHAAVTTGLVPATLGSPLLLSPAPVVPQKQVDYCCGRI